MQSFFGQQQQAGTPSASNFGMASPFGQTQSPQTSPFGQTPSAQTSPFGQTQPSPFGQTQPSLFGQTQPSLFGQTQPSLFGQTQPSLFGQNQPSLLGQQQGQMQANPFGQSFGQNPGTMFGNQQLQMFQTPQLTTQMAPIAPHTLPVLDREIQGFIDAYKEEPGNLKYGFKHLLLSVTDPSARIKPVGVSDIMWAEAMNKLEGMDSTDRERLWPEVIYGFKALSNRLKLQDDAIAADVQRLQATESNVKLLHRHFDTDTLPWIQRLRQKEQELQRRLLKVMRIVEALEGKGFCMALTKGETKLGEQLRFLARQLQGATAELPRKMEGLLSRSRMQAGVGPGSAALLLGPGKIDERSLSNMQEVLRQQTEAIAQLTGVLKRDVRDMDIMISENSEINGETDLYQRSYLRNAVGDGSKLLSGFRKHGNRLI